MASTYLTLGQAAPAATTLTDIYTVPSVTSATVSSITVCNQSATATAFRIAVSVGGGAVATKDYIAYDCPIAGNGVITLTLGITMATTDKLRVYNTLATLSFAAFGVQFT